MTDIYKSITSLETIFCYTKSVLFLLMDDEEETRQRCTEIVMKKLVQADRLNVLPAFAQEQFIDFILQKENFTHFDQQELQALVSFIVLDGDDCLNENTVEYQVFEKNEINLFGEAFIVKKQCISSLQRVLKNSSSNEICKIIETCQKFTDSGKAKQLELFITNLQEQNI